MRLVGLILTDISRGLQGSSSLDCVILFREFIYCIIVCFNLILLDLSGRVVFYIKRSLKKISGEVPISSNSLVSSTQLGWFEFRTFLDICLVYWNHRYYID